MRPYTRAERISNKIQNAITDLLFKKMHDPRVKMATVSRVRLSHGLRIAHVYITVFGNEEKISRTIEGFKQSKNFIKKNIAPELGLKYMPELEFVYDDSFKKAWEMEELIKSVSKDRFC